MKKLKIGVLGVSNHFILRILLPLQKSSLVEPYAISSRSLDKAKKTAYEFNIPKYYGSYEELLKDSLIDIIYIPLPNNIHNEWIKKTADAGKHIICEKPISMNANEAKEAINYAKNKNVYIMEAFMYKFHPQWQRVLELIKAGEIGEITSIHTEFGFNNTDPKNIRNIKSAGGGALMDIGCYASSVPRFILQKEPLRVISLINYDNQFKTDILSSAILDFGDVRATFNVSTQTYTNQNVYIIGKSGKITIEIPFNTFPDVPAEVNIITGVGTRKLLIGPYDHYQIEFEHFAQSIIDKKKLLNPPDDAISNMKVIDALFKSSETNSWVEIK